MGGRTLPVDGATYEVGPRALLEVDMTSEPAGGPLGHLPATGLSVPAFLQLPFRQDVLDGEPQRPGSPHALVGAGPAPERDDRIVNRIRNMNYLSAQRRQIPCGQGLCSPLRLAQQVGVTVLHAEDVHLGSWPPTGPPAADHEIARQLAPLDHALGMRPGRRFEDEAKVLLPTRLCPPQYRLSLAGADER